MRRAGAIVERVAGSTAPSSSAAGGHERGTAPALRGWWHPLPGERILVRTDGCGREERPDEAVHQVVEDAFALGVAQPVVVLIRVLVVVEELARRAQVL